MTPDLATLDIPALYERAKAGDGWALDALSNAAGAIVGVEWVQFGINHNSWGRLKPCALDLHQQYEWRIEGHHAPCLHLICAASVPMPDGWLEDGNEIQWRMSADEDDEGRHYVALVYPQGSIVFRYTDPAHRALAELCARLYANQHAMRNV